MDCLWLTVTAKQNVSSPQSLLLHAQEDEQLCGVSIAECCWRYPEIWIILLTSLFDYRQSLWGDNFDTVLQFLACKMELIFPCFRGMFLDESVYNPSGTIWAPIASEKVWWEYRSNSLQTLNTFQFVPTSIYLCSYPLLSSTGLICIFSSCTCDFCFGRHLCSDGFFLTFDQEKMAQLKFISLLQGSPSTDELKSCYLSAYQSRAQLSILPLVKTISLWQRWEFRDCLRNSSKAEAVYVDIGMIWEFYISY